MKVVSPVSGQCRKVVDSIVDRQQVVEGLAWIILVNRLCIRLERLERHEGVAIIVVIDNYISI